MPSTFLGTTKLPFSFKIQFFFGGISTDWSSYSNERIFSIFCQNGFIYPRLICIQSFRPANFFVNNEHFLYFLTQLISLAAIDSMTSLLMSKAKAKNVNDISLITSSAKNLGFCLNNKLKIGALMASGTSVSLQASGLQMWLADVPLVFEPKGATSRYFELFWPLTNLPLNWRKPEIRT